MISFRAKKMKDKDKYPWKIDKLIVLFQNRFKQLTNIQIQNDSESGLKYTLSDNNNDMKIILCTNKCYDTSSSSNKYLKIYENVPFNETIISTCNSDVINFIQTLPQMTIIH